MRSQPSPRAGLVTLTFVLCVLFVSAVPVPSSSSSLSCSDPKLCLSSRSEWTPTLRERSGSVVDVVAQRSSLELEDQLVLRDDIDQVPLECRKSIFTKIKEGFQKVGKKIKSGFQKFGQKVKAGFKKVGQGIKTAAKKVGHSIKTTGAKLAKFGLKVVSTATSVVGKVAGFIPGIGKPIEKAIQGVGKVTDIATNAIQANMGKKLDKGFKIMDKIEHPLKGTGGAVLDTVLKRDISESEAEFMSREWSPELERRDLSSYDDIERRAKVNWKALEKAFKTMDQIKLTQKTPRDLLYRRDDELDARDEWEARELNEIEERESWDDWDARDWEFSL